MEDYINLRIIGISLFIILLFIPVSVLAYDDTGSLKAHSAINKAAIDYFERNLMPYDPFLKPPLASLNGQAVWGYAWDRMEEGGPERAILATSERPDIKKTKRIRAWIIGGGYSADEPEGPTALVHFYDPMKEDGSRYLTDQQMASKILHYGSSSLFDNPLTDARQWGLLDKSKDMEIYGFNFIQDYSYADAKDNLKKALESDDRSNENYGKAWRGVGETMHMISDMTVPAHVRNDGHAAGAPIWDSDPYESSTSETHVTYYASIYSTDYAHSLDYQKDLWTLMDSVAKFTNNNFLSKDTIPGQPGSATRYSLPDISRMTKDKDGYLINEDGTVAAAPNTLWKKLFDNPGQYTTYNDRVLASQRSILIPTAVRASAAVLDRFLPRFTANMSYEPEDPENPNSGRYIMHGSIKLAEGAWNRIEWPDKLNINNGATIVLTNKDGKVTNIRVDPNILQGGMNEFSYNFEANPDDKVDLMYDLGGYIVFASKEESAQRIYFIVCSGKYDGNCTIYVDTKNLPVNPRLEWDFGDGAKTITKENHATHNKFVLDNTYNIKVIVYDDKTNTKWGEASYLFLYKKDDCDLLSPEEKPLSCVLNE